MIERLRLRGFKSIGPKGLNLPFAPITLLLGENSIGKSTILHCLLGLQQSWSEFASLGRFSAVGASVDLGRFSNVQYRTGSYVYSDIEIKIEESTGSQLFPREHSAKDRIPTRSFAFCWNAPTQSMIPTHERQLAEPPIGWPNEWRLGDPPVDDGLLKTLQVGQFEFVASVSDRALRLVLSQESLKCWLDSNPCSELSAALEGGAFLVWEIDFGETAKIEPALETLQDSSFAFAPEDEAKEKEFLDACRKIRESMLSPSAEGTIWRQATLALEGLGKLRSKIRALCHVGGIRHRGKRLYEVRPLSNAWNVGQTGENIVDLLVHYPEVLARTNDLLQEAKVPYRVLISDPETHAKVRELLLEDLGQSATAGNYIGLPDVGTGISQILPIAVQIATFMQPERFSVDPLFLVEQPELHLHPKLQANLARMFASAVTLEFSDGARGGRPVQFLIETHSEHLVRAFSVLVEKGIIPAGAVSLLKLWRDKETNTVCVDRIRLAADGRFQDRWPEGFFPERERLEDGEMP